MDGHLDITSVLADRSFGTFWRSLTEDAGCGVSVVDARGIYRFVSTTATRLLGKHRSEVLGAPIAAILPSDVGAEHTRLYQQVIATSQPMAIEGMVRGRWVSTIARPIELRDESRGAVCVSVPVTDANPREPVHQEVPTVCQKAADFGPLAKLSRRELEVLRFVGLGLGSDEVAHRIFRSAKTVESHRAALGHKLGVSNRIDLARIAITAGLTALTDEGMQQLLSARNGAREPDGVDA